MKTGATVPGYNRGAERMTERLAERFFEFVSIPFYTSLRQIFGFRKI